MALDVRSGIVQPFTMQSVAELRAQLGWSRAKFAQHICTSIRSLINWETGKGQPDAARRKLIYNLQRWHGKRSQQGQDKPTHTYNDDRMKYYEGKPGARWRSMTGQQRSAFYYQRSRYARIRADIEAGRAIGQPVVTLLNDAPDLDTYK
jgi:hypothetical protein